MSETFDEKCYKDMVRKDPLAACLFALQAPEHQRRTFRRWFREALGLKESSKRREEL